MDGLGELMEAETGQPGEEEDETPTLNKPRGAAAPVNKAGWE